MDEESLWTLERAFWLDGQDFYRRSLDPAALMIFPAPAGMMSGEAAIDALGAAPRWVRVDMAERHAVALSPDSAALAYRASASRGGDDRYEALCSSIYRKAGDVWLLCLHQQTPVA